jgi:hypothetical protein
MKQTATTYGNLQTILKSVGNGKGIKDFSIISDTEVNMQHEFDSLEQAQKNVNYWSENLTARLGAKVLVSAVFDGKIVESK